MQIDGLLLDLLRITEACTNHCLMTHALHHQVLTYMYKNFLCHPQYIVAIGHAVVAIGHAVVAIGHAVVQLVVRAGAGVSSDVARSTGTYP